MGLVCGRYRLAQCREEPPTVGAVDLVYTGTFSDEDSLSSPLAGVLGR